MLLLDETDIKELINRYLDSRDWWMIPYLTEGAADIVTQIEERFYRGAKNADFHLLMGPSLPGGTVAFAHKRWLKRSVLQRWLRKFTPDLPAIGAEQDILLPIWKDEGNREDIVSTMTRFGAWLGR